MFGKDLILEASNSVYIFPQFGMVRSFGKSILMVKLR